MKSLHLNKWTYLLVLLCASGLLGWLGWTEHGYSAYGTLAHIVCQNLVMAMTYPVGIVSQFISMPLIFMGITTPGEAIAVSAPICILAGYLQWYVIVPRIYERRQK